MSAIVLLKAFAAAGAAMFVLDLLWLGVVAKGFYARQLGDLLRPDVKWVRHCCSISCTSAPSWCC